jgi:hypothetical protein
MCNVFAVPGTVSRRHWHCYIGNIAVNGNLQNHVYGVAAALDDVHLHVAAICELVGSGRYAAIFSAGQRSVRAKLNLG